MILDSYEHLLPEVYELVSLLDETRRLSLVVTSREPLGLKQEIVFPVEGMQYPPEGAGAMEDLYDAVQLFLYVARTVDPLFTLQESQRPAIVEICRLVDGLPLAITLAAALTRILACEEIASGIRKSYDLLCTTLAHLPERHRSLRAVFEHTWSLLDLSQQELLMRLSVFYGRISPVAALEVANASSSQLRSLAYKSLLFRTGKQGWQIHLPLLPYVREKLTQVPEQQAVYRGRHAQYYADYVGRREGELRAGAQLAASHSLSEEAANLHAMWKYAVDTGRLEMLLRSARGMYHWYRLRSQFQAGRALFEPATAAVRAMQAGHEGDLRLRKELLGLLLLYQGSLTGWQGEYRVARTLLEESLTYLRESGLRLEEGEALNRLGNLAFRQGALERARGLYVRTQQIFEELGDSLAEAEVMLDLGNIHFVSGAYDTALTLYQQAGMIFQRLGDSWGAARSLQSSGNVAILLGHYEQAQSYFRRAMESEQQLNNTWGIAFALSGLGGAALHLGEYEQSQRHLAASLELRRELGNEWAIAVTLEHLGVLFVQMGELVRAEAVAQESLRLFRRIHDQTGEAFALVLFAALADARGEWAEAERRYRESLRRFEALGDHGGLAEAYIGLGNALYQQGQTAAAEECFTTAYTTCQETGNQAGVIQALIGLGKVEARKGESPKAWARFRAGLEKAQVSGAAPKILEILGEIAALCLASEEFEQAAQILALLLAHPATSASLRARALSLQEHAFPSTPAERSVDVRTSALRMELLVRRLLQPAAQALPRFFEGAGSDQESGDTAPLSVDCSSKPG